MGDDVHRRHPGETIRLKRNFTVKAMNVTPAIVYPALLITLAKPFNCICKGSLYIDSRFASLRRPYRIR